MRVWVIAKVIVLVWVIVATPPVAWSQDDFAVRLKLADGLFFDRLENSKPKVPNDLPKAVVLYRQLYDEGYFGAASRLAIAYLFGRGVEKDTKKAEEYLAIRNDAFIDPLMTQLTIQLNLPEGQASGNGNAVVREAGDYSVARQTNWGTFMFAYVQLFAEPVERPRVDKSMVFGSIEHSLSTSNDPNLYYVSGLYQLTHLKDAEKAADYFWIAFDLYKKANAVNEAGSAVAHYVLAKITSDPKSLPYKNFQTYISMAAWMDSRAGQFVTSDAMLAADQLGRAYGWYLLATQPHGIAQWEPFNDHVASYRKTLEAELLPNLTSKDKAEGEAFAKQFRDEHPIW